MFKSNMEAKLKSGLRCRRWLVPGLVWICLLAACAGPRGSIFGSPALPNPPVINVFAAASLGDAYQALGSAFQAQTGIQVDLILAGSQQLGTKSARARR
jgi:ABC-type molybdate transport system substrate-binding protein